MEAAKIAEKIQDTFDSCLANFDLEDSDRILRIENRNEPIAVDAIIDIVNQNGFLAEPLDDIVVLTHREISSAS